MLGIGYRPELALFIERHPGIKFVEILAEDFPHPSKITPALKMLAARGVQIIPHSVSLNLGGTGATKKQLKHLQALASYFASPFVSDHIAYVRSRAYESGHLLPVKRTKESLSLLLENIDRARQILGTPLVLENIAVTFDWPGCTMSEAEFLTALLEQSDCNLLLDLSNLFANSYNLGFDALAFLKSIPLSRLEYVHLAGGTFKQGLYHDTHCHPLKEQSLRLLSELAAIKMPERVMLERDDNFASPAEIEAELDAIEGTIEQARVKAKAQTQENVVETKASVSRPAQATGSNGTRSAVTEIERLSESQKKKVALEQEILLEALMLGKFREDAQETVGEFDRARVEQAHSALKRKRSRTIKRAMPALATLVGAERLDELLEKYFTAQVNPASDGPYVDGLQFLDFLGGLSEVTDNGISQAFSLSPEVRREVAQARSILMKRQLAASFTGILERL